MAVPMLAGASAGVVGRVLCHPIDTIKSKLQVEIAADRASWSSVLKRTLRSQGIAGLYRGVGVAVIGSCPAACLYFTSYETLKAQLCAQAFCSRYPFVADFVAGFGAEAVACILFVPIDVVKERLQVQSTMVNAAQYSGSLDACRTILRKEGLAGIYKGYWATLASFGPFSALYFLFYEQFKSAHAKYLASDSTRESSQPLPSVFTLFHGAAAGGIASFLTNGLDMAKLRLQVQRGSRAAAPATGAATSAASFQYSVSPRFLPLHLSTCARVFRHRLCLTRRVLERVGAGLCGCSRPHRPKRGAVPCQPQLETCGMAAGVCGEQISDEAPAVRLQGLAGARAATLSHCLSVRICALHARHVCKHGSCCTCVPQE